MVRKITLVCRQVTDIGNNKTAVVLNNQNNEHCTFIDDSPICHYAVGAQYDVTIEAHDKATH